MINQPIMPVGQLMSLLSQPSNMMARFNLPYSMNETCQLLCAGIQAIVAGRRRKFDFNDNVREQIVIIAEWLTGNGSEFGLLLCGGCGTGKTTFAKAIAKLINSLELIVDLDANYIEKYEIRTYQAPELTVICRTKHDEWKQICNQRMLIIDDLGTEPKEVSEYSNVLYPIIELLQIRYEKQLFTIVTTNLTPEQFREKYGDRIADRMNEMMVKVVFKNPSYRTPQS